MSAVISNSLATIDLAAVKSRQQAAWSAGNYAVVGTTLQIVGETLCESLDSRSGSRVLDVAAGNGNATLAAARRWCDVTSTDYVPSLLESGKARAAAEGHTIQFQEADAENLPFSDASFDVAISTFGVMFTPNQEKAASELARVCKPGGRIGLANWTPDSFIGQVFKTIGKYVPPAPGVRSPALWGTLPRLEELFGKTRSADPGCEQRIYLPLSLAGTLARGVSRLLWSDDQDLRRTQCRKSGRANPGFAGSHGISRNRSGDHTLVLPSEYLEIVIDRK